MSYQMDTKSFEAGMKRYGAELKTQMQTILKKSATVYAERASRYVPPRINGKWAKGIPAKLYKRAVEYIPAQMKRDATNRKEYSQKLKEGYRYVVRGRLRGKMHKWFATTLRKAKAYTRIYNRGLFKFLFGGNLASIGEAVPASLQKLLDKSPNLQKHVHENRIQMKSESTAESIRIGNDAWGNQAFARESIYQGEKGAKSAMRKLWKEFEAKRQNV